MIKYNVGDLIETANGVYIVIKAVTDCLPYEHRYVVMSQDSGQTKEVGLFNLTHRCI